ncbi:glycerol kinase [Stylonychia lemnae]|uniref:glycerol kinase n=1 Tax=Stylonychia lemnae TaxID=5949 RepID=A0A078A255_STYLE|nr:glycerol kinase [Stylonychia lemnae]|eukprot:CDW76220.1 glycerol kinase [Stylonychia lemnae]
MESSQEQFGTTSSRVLVINHNLKVLDVEQREHQQIALHPGWNEHDPEAIYSNVVICLEEVSKRNNLSSQNVKAIGITNQRETVVAFDRETGKALYNAIVWNDKRTSDVVKQFSDKNNGNLDVYREVCGLPINTYFSAVKMRWLLDHVEAVRDAHEKGTLKLTSGKHILTDSSNASRTMLMDIHQLQWSDFMLGEFGIKKECLPEIRVSSSDNYGEISTIACVNGVQITGVIGDQQSACLGHLLKVGEVKNTYGTGCFILKNVGAKPVQSTHGLLTTLCYSLGEGQTYYALEGAVEVAGAAIQWAKSVGLLGAVKELESLCYSVDDCGDVYFVPAFNGIFSPYWRDDARGLMIGISLNTTKGHIARAILEAPCLRTAEVVTAMAKDSGYQVTKMNVDGGMSVNNFVLQSQADFTNVEIVRKKESEITGIGAAIAAGLKVGFWANIEEVEKKIEIDRSFKSDITESQRDKKLKRWQQAVERSLGFGWAETEEAVQ